MQLIKNIGDELYYLSKELLENEKIFFNFLIEPKMFLTIFDKTFNSFQRNIKLCLLLFKIKKENIIEVNEKESAKKVLEFFSFNKKDFIIFERMFMINEIKKESDFEFIKGRKILIMHRNKIVRLDYKRVKQFLSLNRKLLNSTNLYIKHSS